MKKENENREFHVDWVKPTVAMKQKKKKTKQNTRTEESRLTFFSSSRIKKVAHQVNETKIKFNK